MVSQDVLMKQGLVITSKVMGLVGYTLLKVLFSGIITFKSDIYNLSLYINNYGDIDYDEEVLKNWRNRLDRSLGGRQLERVCSE